MTNKKHIGKYLIALFTCMCFASSCTYDYFEDETNYIIYVPKVDANKRTDTYKIDDLKILIYTTSSFERERNSFSPFEDNARSRVGDFNFKIFPGKHNVYCFSNISQVNFSDTESYEGAKFDLNKEGDYYREPQAILLDKLEPDIIFPGPVKRDTSLFEHKYVGQICVACKQLEKIDNSLVASNIKSVDIVASGVGVKQPLSQITYNQNEAISSRNSAQDRMFLTSTVYNDPLPGRGFEFGFANYYFPSPILPESEKNEPIRLELTFKDGSNQMLYKPMIIDLVDKTTSEKIILHMNQILVIELDGSEVNIFELTDPLDWNPNIDQGETEF